jgi:DNA-binding response OmpR family regulator
MGYSRGMVPILIVEDNQSYAAGLRSNLEIEGFEVEVAHDGTTGLRLLHEHPPALVILDLMLPGVDGYEVLRAIRDARLDVPVLVLTARKDEPDKLRAFGLGGDDYVTKPCGILELVARVRALLRRAQAQRDEPTSWMRIGQLEIFPPTRSARRDGAHIELRPKEYDLLLALIRHSGRIVSRAELLREVWGYTVGTVSRTVDTHIVGLRQKVETDPLAPEHILTVRSAGYFLRR